MSIEQKINYNTITGIKFLEELYSKTTGKYTNSGYKPYKKVNAINLSFINTIYFSEALCKRYDLNSKDEKDEKTFQPELGLMLIKKILYDSLDLELLTPEFLVSIFNKNQELIEIPYIYALYLGGLHYFNTNKNIGLKRDFAITNHIMFKGVKTNKKYDIYDIYKIITRDSYYKLEPTIEFNNDEKNDKGDKVNIQNLSTLNGLACGYGIQHNFLNKYYELLFNKPISEEISEEKGKPYAMIGGYNGIIKPLKINSGGYNVNDSIDFIGLYRNVCVAERAFANITDNEIINDVKNQQFFLAYSKLKAKYLSGLYDDRQFETICEELDKDNFSGILFTQIFNQNIIQQNFFGSKINRLIDEADNNTTKMIVVLREMWTLEKNNMLNQYSKISKSTYCLIPSAGGVINFDSLLMIDELKDNLPVINYGFLCNLQKILWFEDNLSLDSLMDNIKKDEGDLPFNFFQRNTFTDSVEEINPDNKNLLYYFNTLLDSLDIEKLEYFTNLFTDFCDMKQKNNDNGYTLRGYTLRSLLLGITTIGYDDISDISIDQRVTYTKDDINLLLIGNSVYTYDSVYDNDISMVLNIALTQAQYNNYQKIRKDFLNNKITIANLSTIGPLKYNTSPELSLHKIITLPEIMFSNANNYEEVIANINKINKNNDKESNLFLTRRLLFNNQFVEEFSVSGLQTWENKELRELNNIYMIHPSLLKGNKNLDDITNIAIKFDDITNIVIKFFETLNIKYNKNNYLLLLRLIRGFVYYYYNAKGEIEIRLN